MAMLINNGGELDRRCTLQACTITKQAGYGEAKASWTDVATVWCKVLDGAESDEQVIAGAKVTYVHRCEVGIRWRAGVTTDMRLRLDNGALMQINNASMRGRKEWLVLSCAQWRHQQP